MSVNFPRKLGVTRVIRDKKTGSEQTLQRKCVSAWPGNSKLNCKRTVNYIVILGIHFSNTWLSLCT